MTDVLIGIPTLNGPQRLARCLAAMDQCTDWGVWSGRVKLLVCDDGSTRENLEAGKEIVCGSKGASLRERAGLEMLMHPTRMGIARSWNDLTRHQWTEVVVLANDDIEVEHDWLDVLYHSVTRNEVLGMVSLNQRVSVTKGQLEAAFPHLLPHEREPHIDYHEARLMTGAGTLLAAQGSIFAFRREVFDAVGGFDDARYSVFYEEVDFGVMLRSRGLLHAIASYPIVIHMGGATTSDPKNLDARAELERSRKAFHEKWGLSPSELREKYRPRAPTPALDEWNTQLKFLR
jgi:GT2 family glycosyltransferase